MWMENLPLTSGRCRCPSCHHKLRLKKKKELVELKTFSMSDLDESLDGQKKKKLILYHLEPLTHMDLTRTNSHLAPLPCDRPAHCAPACMNLYMHYAERAKLISAREALCCKCCAPLVHWRSRFCVTLRYAAYHVLNESVVIMFE